MPTITIYVSDENWANLHKARGNRTVGKTAGDIIEGFFKEGS